MIKKLIPFYFLFAVLINAGAQKFEGLAETPPMGWNSWNYFNCDGISERTIMEIADAMVRTGMQDAGYEYIVIDDCWQVGRDEDGTIIADPEKFPSGIKALAEYVHSKGLKFGLYSDAGVMTCAGRPGGRGYEFQDARTYAEWGVDYLKYDWCNVGEQSAKASYTLMRDALYKAGRPILFSMCEWGLSKPWLWAEGVSHIWRTTGDIRNNWTQPDAKGGKVWGGGILVILDMQQELEQYAGPGHWNDPDMLEIGNGVLSEAEERSHFSLWCMLSAPLMAGNDLRNMSESTQRILTNQELIAINQDAAGKQGFKIKDYGEFEIYYKSLKDGDIAICLFNRAGYSIQVELDWKNLAAIAYKESKAINLSPEIDRNDVHLNGDFRILDVWKKQFVGRTDQLLKTSIASHDVMVFRLEKE